MVIERTKDEIIIKLPSNIDIEGLQRFVDFSTYKEATANSQAKHEIDVLAKEIKKGWWKENKSRLF